MRQTLVAKLLAVTIGILVLFFGIQGYLNIIKAERPYDLSGIVSTYSTYVENEIYNGDNTEIVGPVVAGGNVRVNNIGDGNTTTADSYVGGILTTVDVNIPGATLYTPNEPQGVWSDISYLWNWGRTSVTITDEYNVNTAEAFNAFNEQLEYLKGDPIDEEVLAPAHDGDVIISQAYSVVIEANSPSGNRGTTNITYLLPYATYVETTGAVMGHIIAPNATVKLNGGQSNGCIVAQNLDMNYCEVHFYPGEILWPDPTPTPEPTPEPEENGYLVINKYLTEDSHWSIACDVMGDEDWAPDITNTTGARNKEGHQKKYCGTAECNKIYIGDDGLPYAIHHIKNGSNLPNTATKLYTDDTYTVEKPFNEIRPGMRIYWTTQNGNQVWHHTGIVAGNLAEFEFEVNGEIYTVNAGGSLSLELPAGTYEVIEKAKGGYEISTVSADYTVQDDGTHTIITIVGGETTTVDFVNKTVIIPPEPEPMPEPTVEPTPEPTVEPTPTLEPTPEPTPTPTPEPTQEPIPTPTQEPIPTPTSEPAEPTPSPAVEPSPTPTIIPEPTPEITPTPTVIPEPTPEIVEPTATPTPTVEPKPTEEPILIPTPTLAPTATPTPTIEPTPVPTEGPTPTPIITPTPTEPVPTTIIERESTREIIEREREIIEKETVYITTIPQRDIIEREREIIRERVEEKRVEVPIAPIPQTVIEEAKSQGVLGERAEKKITETTTVSVPESKTTAPLIQQGVLGVKANPKAGVLGERIGPETADASNVWVILAVIILCVILGVTAVFLGPKDDKEITNQDIEQIEAMFNPRDERED